MSVGATGSAAGATGAIRPGASRVGLAAQLERLKKQLSDCVNCESARTQSGKANIQQIANRIGATEARLRQIDLETGPGRNGVNGVQASAPRVSLSTVGTRVDYYA